MTVPEGGLPPEAPAVAPPLVLTRRTAWLRSVALTLEQRRALVLALLLSVATVFRCLALDTAGLAEDEVNKVRAVAAYRHLDFTYNAEHPMLMKLAVLGSMELARGWNHLAARARWTPISPEAALRFPNALAGGATTVVIFLLVELLFDAQTAGWASLLWALDVNATAVNRIAKEDTLLVFFFLLAAWCYQRGKREGDPAGAQRWYTRSGAAFGLMLASKYMPHYFAMHAIFIHAADPHPGPARRPNPTRYYVAFLATFLLANFAILLPANFRYIFRYLHEGTLAHNGYLFAHHLYLNTISMSPWGLPPSFYFVFLATKVPVVVLLAFGVGLVQLVVRRREWGFIFTRVIIVFFLLGYSLIAGKFMRYMLPLFAVIDIVAAAGIVWLLQRVRALRAPEWLRAAAMGVAGLAFAGGPLYAQMSAAPYYSLYQNAVGAREPHPGFMFPHCEFYDVGMREAVQRVAAVARPGAILVSEAPEVVEEYLARANRPDLQSWSLTLRGVPMHAAETWVLVQDGRVYFENAAVIEQLRTRSAPWREIRVHGAVAVQIFPFPAARPLRRDEPPEPLQHGQTPGGQR